MISLRPLVRWDSTVIYLNTAHVIALEPASQPGRTRVVFALVDTHDCAGLHGLLSETVMGTPAEVRDLLTEPAGLDNLHPTRIDR